MQFAIITDQGCEEFCKAELEKFGVDSKISHGVVVFDSPIEDALKIAYVSQTAKRMLLLKSHGKFGSLDMLAERATEDVSADDFSKQSFRVECEREGDHGFNSVEVERVIGERIESMTGSAPEYKNPEITFYVKIKDDDYTAGIDVAGRDLSKRQYRVFNHAASMKGTIAASLLIFAGYEKKKVLIDPFSLSGTIPIEAAFMKSGVPVRFYEKSFSIMKMKRFKDADLMGVINAVDKKITEKSADDTIMSIDASFQNINAQRKNAKIAGVDKFISFSRNDVGWLDIKMPEKSVDIICTRIPEMSNHVPESRIRKLYEEFFDRAKYILKKNGIIAVILQNPILLEEVAEKHGFGSTRKQEAYQGNLEFKLILMNHKK